MKNKKLLFVIKIIILIFSIAISSMGISLFYALNIGTDPISVLVDGEHNLLKMSFGNITLMNNLVLLAFGFIFARKYIKIGTVVSGLTTGYFINLFVPMFESIIPSSTDYIYKVILLIPAVTLLALGIAVSISLNFGVGTMDLITLSIRDRVKVELKWIKIGLDFIYTLVGFCMGGIIGLGTIIGVLLTGPLIDLFMPISGKILGNLVSTSNKEIKQ